MKWIVMIEDSGNVYVISAGAVLLQLFSKRREKFIVTYNY
jgi:hypothetical protein